MMKKKPKNSFPRKKIVWEKQAGEEKKESEEKKETLEYSNT